MRSTSNRFLLILFLIVSHSVVNAQEYYVKQFRVEKGLPSDIIKGCAQDSLGFFWIATDEGLIKYDGIGFTSYRRAMHSNYAKGLFTTRSKRLLAFGDLDVIEIHNTGDTVTFKSLCPVSRVSNDSSLSYPKLIFEDLAGRWISESQSVVRLQNKTFKRYRFDFANRSPQFLRSFSFFEDKQNNLFAVSFQGNVFKFNPTSNSFDVYHVKFPAAVEFIGTLENRLIIGSSDGLSTAELLPAGGFSKPELRMKIPNVSFVTAMKNGRYFISTRGAHHYIGELANYTFKQLPKPINNINHTYFSRENDVWLSSNEGLIMMRENLFQNVNPSVTDFIESIAEDPKTGIIYYATSLKLYSYNPITKENQTLLEIPNGYFQSMEFNKRGLWIANAFKVFTFNDNKISHEFDFSKDGRFVTDLIRGPLGNIWLTIPGSTGIFMIDTLFRLRPRAISLDKQAVINAVRDAKDGIYAAATGSGNYLYFKAKYDSVFKNISLPLTFPLHGEFNVADVAVSDGKIWLATSEGLLKYENQSVTPIDLGASFSGLPVKSLRLHPGNKLLVSTAYGMILYDIQSGLHDLFTESSGLLSNSITNHGFLVSSDQTVWIGTANGLCRSIRPLTQLNVTPKPHIIAVSTNGSGRSLSKLGSIDYGSFVAVKVSSITFPENEISFQYRLLPDETWKVSQESTLQFSGISSGNHTLEVRTKKNGPYTWSATTSIDFTVTPPFWEVWWFYVLCLVLVTFIIAATFLGVDARNRKRNRHLQALIDERTAALRLSNQELINLNQEKNNLIGIVAHDLKSPLRQIMGLLSLIKMTSKVDDETSGYLGMVEKSATRLNEMIMKILDVDAIESKQLNIRQERIDLPQLMNAIGDRYEAEAAKKNIIIQRKINPEIAIVADKNYTEQIIDNLVSNAIKFSPFNKNIFLCLTIQDDKALIEIKDEGPGISDADKKNLFGKYQKLSARPTGDEISTGLGLSIVKRFVVAMKGEIWCDSETGKGASFFVSFKTE